MAFKPVDPRVSFPDLEQEIAAWWRAAGVIKQSLGSGDRSNPFVFFEGPPTANGLPGVHHVEARATKDVINRYQRMRGRYVIGARGGWDTHGLPVEVQVEKELGFNGKPDIEKYGIKAFNAACRASVNRYVEQFERLTERIAFWLDLDHPYATCDNSYIESLWWIVKQLWEKDLLFRDYKVTMHCPRCGTSLSDHEVAQGFEEGVDDPSVWVKFKVAPSDHPLASELVGACFLIWTTTPWTLPANAALAVGPDADYALAEQDGVHYIVAQALLGSALGEGARTLQTFSGRELAGLRYEPLFRGVRGAGEAVDWATAYRVVADDFVSLEDGTGVVHIAPAYGDLEVGRTHGLPTLFSVDLAGEVLHDFDDLGFGGMFFKAADPLIARNLDERGLLFKSERVRHAYPFCWRCRTPLLYYAKRSWYIRTTAVKDRLVAHNQVINWVPEYIKQGRFGNWLENNIDWAVSRERYWGTPLPIWVCAACGRVEVIGSVAELSARAGADLALLDLHRPDVDEPRWACASCGGVMRRVPDVADVWFDSGAMPLAQWHYPFENRDMFEVAGQADFISEGLDQTRGWFYTLHALATLLFDRPAFKNVICLGILLGADGRRMSKSRGTAVDPFALVDQYGADAARWYMFASAPPYNSRRFVPEHVGEMLRQFMLTLWNTYSFFVTYANLDGWTPQQSATQRVPGSQQPAVGDAQMTADWRLQTAAIDRWALASLNKLVREVSTDLERYDIYQPTKRIEAFVEHLSNWYVRRCRRRFWKAEDDADKHAAYQTLYTCLITLARLMAPFTPFLSEAIYRNLMGLANDQRPPTTDESMPSVARRSSFVGRPSSCVAESVHLAAWPEADAALLDEQLLADTALLLDAVSLGRAARKAAGLKVRQPLRELWVRAPTTEATEGLRRFASELRDELNVKTVRYLDSTTDLVEYRFKPNLRLLGKKYGKLVPALTAALRELSGDTARDAARAVEDGRPVALVVDGQALALLPEELLVETSSPQGYAVAEENGLLVALDTTLTDELREEGLARELVRNIQDARKRAGFAIADRIAVYVSGAGEIAAIIERWGDYIRAETLADDLLLAEPPPGAHAEALDLDRRTIKVGVVRH
jgi:isoleucyl-tRNA synthetase